MDDRANLQNLHDIVMPAPVAWWPPAPGWYLVMVIAAGALLVLLWNAWRHWRRNRYRGEALRELARIRGGGPGGDLRETPILLKRAALSAWPRKGVAGLAGAEWHQFLDESAQTDRFRSGVGELLDRLAYDSAGDPELSGQEAAAVLDAAQSWIKRHRAPPAGG